jgi:predicted glycoside hydrolase/deacetylase ChbG (UPF0249 family)
MCHPAIVDARLRQESIYVEERQQELNILCDSGARLRLTEAGVRLVDHSRLAEVNL